jgi:hypothetical protein
MLPDRFLQSSFILNVGLVPGRAWLELSVPYIDCNGDVFRDFEYIDDTNMQFPVHFGFGGFSISAHFVFETLAFIIGFRYFLYLRKKVEDPISEGNRIWILIAAAAGALIFSRLLGSLEFLCEQNDRRRLVRRTLVCRSDQILSRCSDFFRRLVHLSTHSGNDDRKDRVFQFWRI